MHSLKYAFVKMHMDMTTDSSPINNQKEKCSKKEKNKTAQQARDNSNHYFELDYVHKNAEHSSTPNSSNESSSASVFQKDRISLPPDSVGKMVELMEKLNLTMQTLAQSLKQ